MAQSRIQNYRTIERNFDGRHAPARFGILDFQSIDGEKRFAGRDFDAEKRAI